jgi:hypothetical protein
MAARKKHERFIKAYIFTERYCRFTDSILTTLIGLYKKAIFIPSFGIAKKNAYIQRRFTLAMYGKCLSTVVKMLYFYEIWNKQTVKPNDMK